MDDPASILTPCMAGQNRSLGFNMASAMLGAILTPVCSVAFALACDASGIGFEPANDQALAPLRHCYATAIRRIDDGRTHPQTVGQRVASICGPETEALVKHYGSNGTLGTSPDGVRQTLECWATGVVAWMRRNPDTVAPPPESLQLRVPAMDAEVHVISVYEGQGPITVKAADRRSILVLLSFMPVTWSITVEPGASLRRVVAIGYAGKPRISPGLPVGTTSAVTDMTFVSGPQGIRLQGTEGGEFPRSQRPPDLTAIAAISRALTEKGPATYQGSYTAPSSGFVVDGNIGRFKR